MMHDQNPDRHYEEHPSPEHCRWCGEWISPRTDECECTRAAISCPQGHGAGFDCPECWPSPGDSDGQYGDQR